jgi:hypothetical protein
MKMKTESGVLISFIPQGSSKIFLILFDKPVRAIELKKGEITQIGSFVASHYSKKVKRQPQNTANPQRMAKSVFSEEISCTCRNGK